MENVIFSPSSNTNNKERLTLHPKLAEAMEITRTTIRNIRFGAKTYQTTVRYF